MEEMTFLLDGSSEHFDMLEAGPETPETKGRMIWSFWAMLNSVDFGGSQGTSRVLTADRQKHSRSSVDSEHEAVTRSQNG